jgi:hypothetical protein
VKLDADTFVVGHGALVTKADPQKRFDEVENNARESKFRIA